jgi:gas vesicle protein
MAEDPRRTTRPPGALGREDRREERLLDDVRREIRREVAAIRDEVAHAVARKWTEGWERLEHMLAQQAEEAKKQAEEAKKQAEEAKMQAAEDRKWRLEVARRLEALEQALRVGSAFQGSEEERGKAAERGTKRARIESEGQTTCGEGRTTPEAPRRAPATPHHQGGLARHQGEGLAQSQHAPQAGDRQKAQKPASVTPMPGLGAVRKPEPTYADIASRPVATSADGFTTVGKNGRARKERNADRPEDYALKPITRGNTEDDRKVIFPRDGYTPHPASNQTDVLSEVNRALRREGVPDHIRLVKLRRNENGVLTGLVGDRTNATQFLLYRDTILRAARKADSGVIAVESNETWARLKIHGVPLHRYMKDDPAEGLRLLREEIEAENPGVTIPLASWLVAPRLIKARRDRGEISKSSVVFAVKERSAADRLRTKGIRAAGIYYAVERYVPEGPDAICARCCGWGHIEEKCEQSTPHCMWCAGNHRSSDHRCLVTVCSAKPGDRCQHTTEKCCNCGGKHNARSKHCPQKTEAIRRAKVLRSGGDKRTREEPARPRTDLAAPSQSTATGTQEPAKDDTTADDTPGLLLLEAPNMDDDEDPDGSSSLSSLPSDMEVDETQH